jgi:hypothetical protein
MTGYKPNGAAWFASNSSSHKLRAASTKLRTPFLYYLGWLKRPSVEAKLAGRSHFPQVLRYALVVKLDLCLGVLGQHPKRGRVELSEYEKDTSQNACIVRRTIP